MFWANAILVPIHPMHRANQIGHTVDDFDMKLLITESARMANSVTQPHGRIVLGRPAEQGIASLEELRRDLSADVVSQYLCSFMSHSLLSALLINEPHRQKTG